MFFPTATPTSIGSYAVLRLPGRPARSGPRIALDQSRPRHWRTRPDPFEAVWHASWSGLKLNRIATRRSFCFACSKSIPENSPTSSAHASATGQAMAEPRGPSTRLPGRPELRSHRRHSAPGYRSPIEFERAEFRRTRGLRPEAPVHE